MLFNPVIAPFGAANEIIQLSMALAEANVINQDLSASIAKWQEERNRREQEIAELRAELADLDTVPRSRYNACNQDWIDAEKALGDVRKIAKREIEDREKEIAALQVELIDLRAGLAESKANYDKALNAIEAAAKIGGGYLDEIAALRARVKELEGMVPKWVKTSDAPTWLALVDAGWSMTVEVVRGVSLFRLMVPPIPLPEGEVTESGPFGTLIP